MRKGLGHDNECPTLLYSPPEGRILVGFDDLDAAGAVASDYGGAEVSARGAEGTGARSERRVFKDVALDRST